MAIAQEIGEKQILRNTYKTLTKAYENAGDYKNAYQRQVDYTALSETILNEENVKYMSVLESQYESEKKEKEIVVLHHNREIQEAAIGRKNTLIYTFLIVLSLLLLLILLMVLFFVPG